MKRTHPILRAFWADRRAAAAAVFLGVEILVVLLLPLFLGQDPNLTDREAGFWAPPSSQHLLGTDDVGRDIFARLLY
ncbi:MAG TPA: ABC transporter permease, partial [Candidatus Evtepia excrementipullorum]|nr:ABC transporter permease [Candidatus Evtepia excrementipullorum]